MNLDDLERALGHTFSDRTHLLEALTHKTWLMEQQARGLALDLRDQQRLEFLGDAFLNYEVGRLLFLRFPKASEGDLTARRRSLVKGENIHAVGESVLDNRSGKRATIAALVELISRPGAVVTHSTPPKQVPCLCSHHPEPLPSVRSARAELPLG